MPRGGHAYWTGRSKGKQECTIDVEEVEEDDEYGRMRTVTITTATCNESGASTQAYGDSVASVRRALTELTKEVCNCGATFHTAPEAAHDD